MQTPDHDQSFLKFQDPNEYEELRHLLKATGYTESGVAVALDVKSLNGIAGSDVPLLQRRTSRGTPLDALIRLFLVEMPCDADILRRVIQPMKLEAWLAAGLVTAHGNSVKAAIKLLPFKDLVVAFDLPEILQSDLLEKYVMGIGSSTLTLVNLTIRRPSRATLDLGAGCGIHALLAAPHSERVAAVDLNPRALQFADFNARLNGLFHMECLEGDLFEPVRGQTFDLVVSNPPFVISPESRYIYRDGGMSGDRITRKIVQEVPQYLNEGGYCQILCNWAETSGQGWQERLHTWFAGSGCDVWVMRSETLDAATYASTWIQHTERAEADRYGQQFEEWMAYYERLGITSMGAGLITMRKSSQGKNWFRADEAPKQMLGPCGEYIARGFQLRDFLEAVRDDAVLLNIRLHYSPDVRLERQALPSEQGWLEDAIRLHLAKGLAYGANIDPFVANMVVNCNGQYTLQELLEDMASALGRPVQEIIPPFCKIVRQLISQGFLYPEGFPE